MKNDGLSRVYLALLHYPVYNKNRDVVTSAVTNLDIHDIARLVRTYNLGGYFIVNPDGEQREVAEAIVQHWRSGYGATYNKDRSEAMKRVRIVASLAEVDREITGRHERKPFHYVTTANAPKAFEKKIVSNGEAKKQIEEGTNPALLLFGTGWGLAEEILETSDFILEPILGEGEYNHLSVRSAASIVVDRLFGRR